MYSITIFNNKGGVGKTTLSFHFAHALARLGRKVLVIDLDPQCNLTILSVPDSDIFPIWDEENEFIENYEKFESLEQSERAKLLTETRSMHFLLKSSEDGLTDFEENPPPLRLANNIDLLPGRLTLHSFEDKVGERWANAYKGDPLAVRTVTQIRSIARRYADHYGYEFVIFDTSPSLGMLNRVILSMADGFIIPCLPDKFSLYGIANIGRALVRWQNEFDIIRKLQSKSRSDLFPSSFVKFLGYTIYNARPYRQDPKINKWDLATGHFNFAKMIPETIRGSIPKELMGNLSKIDLEEPIGGTSIMHTHNTLPNVAQKYHVPIWELPSKQGLDQSDRNTIVVNRKTYLDTAEAYQSFSEDVLRRINA